MIQKFELPARLINAVQYSGSNADEILSFLGGQNEALKKSWLLVRTSKKVYTVHISDWVILFGDDEFMVFDEQNFLVLVGQSL